MLKERRHKRILSALSREGSVDIHELSRMMPDVSRVTLRRDIADLAEAGALKRTHGGAVVNDEDRLKRPRTGPSLVALDTPRTNVDALDAIILPPIEGRGGDALRRQIVRRNLPFLAESSPQAGGVYLGPDNHVAGFELGKLAGASLDQDMATLLVVCQAELANTRARTEGFLEGFRASYVGDITVIRANGKGNYKTSFRVARDALSSSNGIAIGFGVNDHSALGILDAAEKLGQSLAVYACGGEDPNFVGRLAEGGDLKAVAAFFPTIVGEYAIDLAAHAIRGNGLPQQALTPHRLVTAASLADFYACDRGAWTLRTDFRDRVDDIPMRPAVGSSVSGRVGFMPHYPAHDWYRSMLQAMRDRCDEHGLELVVSPPHHGIAAEISRLRRLVAKVALERIQPDQTIILGEGEATYALAEELSILAHDAPQRVRGITVITNALDVLHKLTASPHLKVILTSGEYQSADQCMVGPSLGALFERMRADIGFLSVSGVSPTFGLSNVDERLALAGSRFVQAARKTIALADHTLVGTDGNHRVARAADFHELITDDGALASDRQKLRAMGIEVTIAEEEEPDTANQGGEPITHLQTA